MARHLRGPTPTEVGLGPELRVVYDDDRFEWKTDGRRHRPGPLVRGRRRVRREGAQARRGRGPRDLGAARRDRDGPDRLLRLRQRRRLLRGHRSGRPRERRGLGLRRHPDPPRAHPARPDQRFAGGRPDPARVRPPRLRHRVEEPVSQPAALAQRGPGGLPERGLRVVRPRPGRGVRPERHAHPARRADRPVPERPGLLPRLFRERLRRRVHDPDLRPRRPGDADPLVRRGADRRRGVQRCAGARHDRLRRRLVQGRQGDAEDQVRATARATGAGAVGVDRRGARRPGVATAVEPGSRGRRLGRRRRATPVPGAAGDPAADDGATLVGILVAIGAIVLLVAAALAARRRRATPPPP